MHILVTNDDGINHPGLLALAQAMRALGEVTVLAPDRNWSASGHVKTMHRPLRARETKLADGTPAMTTDGAPSDCVALAILGLVKKKIDLVVSGINPHANLGHDVTYSGTVTAAMEASIAGIPGVAFSLETLHENGGKDDFAPAGRIAQQVAVQVIEHGLPENTVLNVNIPYLQDDEFKGFRVTRQGLRIYNDELVQRADPHGTPYYWIGGEPPSGVAEEDTDIGSILDGYISITPLQLDLTARAFMRELRSWEWEKAS
ncbi:MAG: 5'/3'-nucleotidase SurE [Anaerolineales bacterium]|nr:5'/3'-nucleotidase SurE [Anaerolineales bacterium]